MDRCVGWSLPERQQFLEHERHFLTRDVRRRGKMMMKTMLLTGDWPDGGEGKAPLSFHVSWKWFFCCCCCGKMVWLSASQSVRQRHEKSSVVVAGWSVGWSRKNYLDQNINGCEERLLNFFTTSPVRAHRLPEQVPTTQSRNLNERTGWLIGWLTDWLTNRLAECSSMSLIPCCWPDT